MQHLQQLKDSIKFKYRNGPDHIGRDFVAPCLKFTQLYRRGTGFFSSGALIAYAESMERMIRGDTKIQILCSPVIKDPTLLAVLGENLTEQQRQQTIEKLANQIISKALEYKNDSSIMEYRRDLLAYFIAKKIIEIKYLDNGKLIARKFNTYFTIHGPIMAKRDGKWISLKSNNRSMNSLEQSWVRTKSKGFDDYKKAMDITANTSNNTVYADSDGNIAYWHGNFIPMRDANFNWAKAVDGTTSTTQWKGLHSVSESVHLYNPKNGWLQNCNSTPYTVSGTNSPKKEDYPKYMAPDGENFRGINAVRLLSKGEKYTLDKVIADGYNTYLAFFEVLIPALIMSFEKNVKQDNAAYSDLAEPIAVLKKWDYYSSTNSVATTLAIEWASKLDVIMQKVYIDEGRDQVENAKFFA